MRRKYLISVLLVLVMLCTCWTGAVAEEEREIFTSGDYEYTLLDDGTVEITKYSGSAEEITISEVIDSKAVTQIGDFSFLRCFSLTRIRPLIPSGKSVAMRSPPA